MAQGMGEGEPGWKSRLPSSQQLQGRANGDRLGPQALVSFSGQGTVRGWG